MLHLGHFHSVGSCELKTASRHLGDYPHSGNLFIRIFTHVNLRLTEKNSAGMQKIPQSTVKSRSAQFDRHGSGDMRTVPPFPGSNSSSTGTRYQQVDVPARYETERYVEPVRPVQDLNWRLAVGAANSELGLSQAKRF